MSLTADFATALSALARAGLDHTAERAATALFVDGVAVAALGAGQTGPRLLADLSVETAGAPAASLIGRRARVGLSDAARTNGAAMHVLDYEPMWNPANHALSTTLPAVLALAERAARAGDAADIGRRLLVALAIGIEAQERLRHSSSQFEPADLVFHPPSAVGPLGSAVACGLMLGLDDGRLMHAIGIAASRAGGILANVGSMTKALHCGGAAAAGLESALLAEKGFTADADALAGPRGFGNAFFGTGFRPNELLEHREPLQIVSPGPAYKLYPSQYGTHFVITAALDARAKLPAGGHIAAVRIRSPRMPYVDRPSPATGLAGKFSFQYTAAAALLDGTVNVDSFTDRRRFAPDMMDLLPRIRIEPDDREGRFDRMTLDVDVTTDDGLAVAGHCDGPPGIWGRPADPARLEQKARDCFDTAYGAGRGPELVERCEAVAGFDGAALLALMDRLATDVPHMHAG